MQPTVDNLTVAVNYLARHERCTRIVNEMDAFIAQWATSPKLFAAPLDVLNPLIMLGVKYPDRYRALLSHVYTARSEVSETARIDYQRDLMRSIRERDRKAVMLAEQRARRTFTRQEKVAFLQEQHREWTDAKRRFVTATDDAAREATRQFWEGVDVTLDRELRRAMLETV